MEKETARKIDGVLKIVYDALAEKGYNAEAQIQGYLFSDDPTYITFHNRARQLLTELDRDEVMARILEVYFDENKR